VTCVDELAERREHVVPTTLVFKGATDGFGDERAPLPTSQTPVELSDKPRIEVNV
jgi:hypothetical protein